MCTTPTILQVQEKYGSCASYLDEGWLEWTLGAQSGIIKFKTFFRRPEMLQFRWTGYSYATRGEGFQIDSAKETVIGCANGKSFLYDPRCTIFGDIEWTDSTKSTILNDSVFSAGIAYLVIPLLCPKLVPLSHPWTLSKPEYSDFGDLFRIRFETNDHSYEQILVTKNDWVIKKYESHSELELNDKRLRELIGNEKYVEEQKERTISNSKVSFEKVVFDSEIPEKLFFPENAAGV